MKKWRYEVESIAPPLGFSSLVIVGLLQLGMSHKPPVMEVFKDGCVILLHKLRLAVKIHSATVELLLSQPTSPKELLNKMGVVMAEAVQVTRTAQRLLSEAVSSEVQGSLEGECFQCGSHTTVVEELNRLTPSYSQFCCTQCRFDLGLYCSICRVNQKVI